MYMDRTLAPELRAKDLLSQMTLREKCGQLTQKLYGFRIYERTGDAIALNDEFRAEVERYSGIGALYALHRADPWSGRNYETGLDGVLSVKARNMVQEYVLEHSRLRIPVLFATESPHGHQALDGYLLPTNLCAAASFRPELLERADRVCAEQMRAMGIDLAFVAVLDILRDPRWGRSEECFGEDPLLASRFARAAVRGMHAGGMDVTVKHLAGQGETTGGINASAATVGKREMHEIHLAGMRACAEEGAASVMATYNEIDGVFCCANPWLLQDVLRKELGFEGIVMSDGCAVDALWRLTEDHVKSVALAVNSGVDLDLFNTHTFHLLEQAVQQGLVSESRVDEAVLRVLRLKFKRGLFDEPFAKENTLWQGYSQSKYPEAKQIADEAVVLLKNEKNILPLDTQKPLRVAVIGPNADDIYNQLGDYTPPVRPGTCTSVWQGLENVRGSMKLSKYVGCEMFQADSQMLERDAAAAAKADLIVAVLGGSSSRFAATQFEDNGAVTSDTARTMDCGEGADAGLLRLPGGQIELLKKLRTFGKPIITVLIQGRPYEMHEIDKNSDAIVCCFYPGPQGGQSIAEVLVGDIAPSGRLPVSLPNRASHLPVYYNHKDSYPAMRYCDGEAKPKYGFGCGITYTEFAFESVSAKETCTIIEAENGVDITVKITNTGARAAYAVPQLYIHRRQGVVSSRVRQLCDFEKVFLNAGESRTVTLSIGKRSLMQWGMENEWILPAGRIEWFVADSGREYLSGEITII